MKNIVNITLITVLISFFACGPSVNDLKKYAAIENYPKDTYLDTVSKKRALIIVAHDDDDCIMSGTISKLHAAGWEIKQFSLQTTTLAEGRLEHPAVIISDGNEAIVEDFDFRNGLDTTKYSYLPIPKDLFDAVFKKEKVTKALIKKVNDFDPSVIFTMDNEMGGYGNPDHIFISQLVLDLSKSDSIHPKRIYQGVYTDYMEKQIIEIRLTKKLKKWGFPNTYMIAKEVYNVTGMPEPTVEVNIQNQSATKMAYLRAYHKKAKKNIRKFIPFYEDFDHDIYFNVFDKEYFRVIEFDN